MASKWSGLRGLGRRSDDPAVGPLLFVSAFARTDRLGFAAEQEEEEAGQAEEAVRPAVQPVGST